MRISRYSNLTNVVMEPVNKWKVIKAAQHQILPRASQGEIKLQSLVHDLKKYTVVEEIPKEEDEVSVVTTCDRIRLFRRKIANLLQQPKFHYIVIFVVIIDLIVVLIDLVLAQLSSPCFTDAELHAYNTTVQRDACLLPYSIHLERADLFLFYFSVLLLTVFVFEVFISIYAFGRKYFKSPLYVLDGTIVLFSFFMELYFHYGNLGRAGRAASAIILIRLWKIIRAIHAVAHSISIKNRLLIEKIQEAQVLLEEEKHQAEQTLERQDIRVDYLVHILTTMGQLPSMKKIDKDVQETWIRKRQRNSK